MQELLLTYYDWLRAFHIIAVISWMAGLLYLPRLFVYHVDSETGSDKSETFKIMEHRLLKMIMNPAMITAWIFGSLMLYANTKLYTDGKEWIYVKLAFVFLLTGMHMQLASYVKKFARDENQKTAKYFRIINEVPAAIMIIIVILAVIEPF